MRYFVLILLIYSSKVISNDWPRKYWISFTDKQQNIFTINNPSAFLSERALLRRQKQDITIDLADLPVSSFYTDSLTKHGIKVLYTSKWMNGATIELMNVNQLNTLSQLSFVQTIELTYHGSQNKSVIDKSDDFENVNADIWGSLHHLSMINAYPLHNKGFTGKGMLIAITDNGFNNANIISSLASVFAENRVVFTRNIVNPIQNIYTDGNHGTAVFSILAGGLQSAVEGTAPDANYILIKTEEYTYEYPVEEDNWIAGAELADSLGADVISVSLGYNVFNDTSFNKTWKQLDGKSVRVSRAASMAVKKGMVVCIAAGNDGQKPWKYIGFPADAEGVLTVGAVDSMGTKAGFSSLGKIINNNYKPDVAALGKGTPLQDAAGIVRTGNGTSFSTPTIAGMAACLWQKYPMATNIQIMDAIRKSGTQYSAPDTLLGYGIPDFGKINLDSLLKDSIPVVPKPIDTTINENAMVFPNPASDYLNINCNDMVGDFVRLEIINQVGLVLHQQTYAWQKYIKVDLSLAKFSNGLFVVRVSNGHKFERHKFFIYKK